jgi:PAS domain S-box-containing protein
MKSIPRVAPSSKSEPEYEKLFSHLNEVVRTMTGEGAIAYVSPNIGRVCGYSSDEIRDGGMKMWVELVHPDDLPVALRAFHAALAGEVGHEVDYRFRRKDGAWIWLRERSASRSEGEDGVLASQVFRDVTEEQRIENALLASQKLEATGRLVGGVAHDFNNMLAVILSSAGYLAEELDEVDPRRCAAVEIQGAAEQARRVTRQLLAFCRRDVAAPEVLSLDDVIHDLSKLLGHLVGHDIDLVVSGDGGGVAVKMDRGHLEQILLNLVVNARDAMPSGGRLAIFTGVVGLDEPFADAAGGPIAAGRYAVLRVRDTGTGMSPSVLERLFDPFFTTKQAGKGTGLGLSMVRSIAAKAGGTVSVESQVGVGTTFQVYLPCAMEADRRSCPTLPARTGMRRSGDVVLVPNDPYGRSALRPGARSNDSTPAAS